MVKFAFIKEVELKDPRKCEGCVFLDLIKTGAETGARYCNATGAGWMIKTHLRPIWCPLVLNYKEALSTADKLLNACLEWDNGGERAYEEIIDFSNLIAKELGKDEPG